jgi:predicted HicB family RNase H-like nuclease
MNEEKTKFCCVRIPHEIHRLAKSLAYENGITLQEMIYDLLKKELVNNKKLIIK